MRQQAEVRRNRFDRRGNVVREERRFGPTFNTDDYRTGDRIFAVRRSSPARRQFRTRQQQAA